MCFVPAVHFGLNLYIVYVCMDYYSDSVSFEPTLKKLFLKSANHFINLPLAYF